MASPVDYDPFAGAEPVDYDPFAASAGTPVEGDPFATVPKNIEEEDMPSFYEEQQPQKAKKPEPTIAEQVVGAGEAGLSMVTGLTGGTVGMIGGFVSGLADEIMAGTFGTPEAADRLEQKAMEGMTALTYEPRTAAGQAQAMAIGEFVGENVPAIMPMGVELEAAARAASPVLRQRAGQMATWAKDRVKKTEAPVTRAEVADAVKQADLPPIDDDALSRLNQQMDTLRQQQKMADEVAKLRPLEKDTIEVKRAKQAAIRRMGGESEEYGNKPLEVKRELERIRKQQIKEIEAKIAKQEDLKARAAKNAQEAAAKSAAAAASQADAFPTIAGKGKPHAVATWGNDVISRIEHVSPELGVMVRRVSQRQSSLTNADISRIDEFYQSSAFNKLSKKDRMEWDRAVLNGDNVTAEAILDKQPGLKDLYTQKIGKLLQDMQKVRVEGGADGFIEYFHPRHVAHYRKLRKHMGKEMAGKVEQAIEDAKRAKFRKNEGDLTEHEIAAIIGQTMGGRPVKVLKDRRITEISPEMQRFYANSRDSLVDYIHNFHSANETRKFFKDAFGADRKLGQTMDEVQLSSALAHSLQKGLLTGPQLDEISKLLASQFGVARQRVGDIQRRFRNVFTIGTLANPMSTLTQFGDVAPLMKEFGVRHTLRAMFGEKAISAYDVGIREASKDFRTQHGTARAVRASLKAVGFDELDSFMATTGVNASFARWRKLARKAPAKAREMLIERGFAREADQLLEDLKAGRLTDDGKTLVFSDMGKIRPVAREDMPLDFQMNPNGRWKYSLMSWTMKQMNYVRNNAYRDIAKGKYTKAVKDFITFAAIMGATNGAVMDLKDWIRGKEVDPVGNFVQGAFSLGMSVKYAMEGLDRGNGFEMLYAFRPVIGLVAGAMEDLWKGASEGEYSKVFDAIPSLRNLKAIWESDIPGAVAGVAMMAIPQAGAAYAPNGYDPTQGATPLPAEPIRAEQNLPAGWEPLPEPQFTPEQLGQQEQPSQAMQEAATKEAVTKEDGVQITVPKNTPAAESRQVAKKLIELREGRELKTYQHKMADGTLDKPTGGVGHVLTPAELRKYPVGTEIPETVVDEWYRKDSDKAFLAAREQAKELGRPDMIPALASVNFQLGTNWYKDVKQPDGTVKKGHKNTWRLLKEGQWLEAAEEAANSRWAKQTPKRVDDFQRAIRNAMK